MISLWKPAPKEQENNSQACTTIAALAQSEMDLPVKTVESSDSLLLNETNSEWGWSQFINKGTKKYHKDKWMQLKQLHHEQEQVKSPSESTGRLEGLKISWFPVKSIFSQVIF